MTKQEKELSFLFLATAFTRTYITNSKSNDNYLAKELLDKLHTKTMQFVKKVKKVNNKAVLILEKVEADLKKETQNRFRQKATTNEHGEFDAHPLLFAVSMVLEQGELKNKKLNLPYKLAKDISKDFEDTTNSNIKNSRILASSYAEKIKGI